MALTDTLKRAPRWAWVTAAGVGIGAAGIKLWNNRAKPDSETTATPTTVYDPTSPYPVPTSTNSPVATIVPPVIIGQDNGDPNAGVGALQDLYIGAMGSVLEAYESVWGPVQTAQLGLLSGFASTIQDLAIAGSAPNSGGQAPGTSVLPVAIVPFPAPAQPAPTPVPAPTPAPKRCTTAPYLNLNEATGKCYAVVCASGNGEKRKGRWHVYQDGHDVFMQPTC